jgi:hypothetical protein
MLEATGSREFYLESADAARILPLVKRHLFGAWSFAHRNRSLADPNPIETLKCDGVCVGDRFLRAVSGNRGEREPVG